MLTNKKLQQGATLIEVLVSILLLSIGAMALGSMLVVTVQMPKLAGYRATAMNLADSYVERMRANALGFELGSYQLNGSSYTNDPQKFVAKGDNLCKFPDCSPYDIAVSDFDAIKIAAREALPSGGIFMLNDSSSGTPSTNIGNLWIIWNEPETAAALDARKIDNCPSQVLALVSSNPRCIYVRFYL